MLKEGDLKLSGNFVLNDTIERKQFFYASQCYGTLFGIYMKINLKCDLIESFEFELINYKGLLNIGFLENGEGFYITRKGNSINIGFSVKALTGIHKTPAPIKPNEEIKIEGLENIYGKRTLIKMNASNSYFYNDVVFDNEYYYRDGDNSQIRSRVRHTGLEECRAGEENCESVRTNKIMTGNCVDTVLKIIH